MVLSKILVDRPGADLRWLGGATWAAAWGLMLLLDGRLALGNLALILVMAGALAGLWLSPLQSMAFSATAVALFNFFFVNPRHTFAAMLHEDLLLLVTLLGVSTGISYLLARLRSLVTSERLHASEREQALLNERAAIDQAQAQHLRNTLLTAISHDYRTPLATMTGAASSLAAHAGKLPRDRVADLARTIVDEVGHLNRMTTNTLQLARLDSVAVCLDRQWESPEEILAQVIARARRSAPAHRVEARVPRHLPLLYCDAVLLVQLFDNLVENAIKYSPAGSTVLIEAIDRGQALEVRVTDAGPGVPDAWKEKVFDVFQRIDSSQRSADASADSVPRRGVGVGLAVCRAIVRVHGAGIRLCDAQPTGTVAEVLLPVQAQPTMPAQLEEVAT